MFIPMDYRPPLESRLPHIPSYFDPRDQGDMIREVVVSHPVTGAHTFLDAARRHASRSTVRRRIERVDIARTAVVAVATRGRGIPSEGMSRQQWLTLGVCFFQIADVFHSRGERAPGFLVRAEKWAMNKRWSQATVVPFSSIAI